MQRENRHPGESAGEYAYRLLRSAIVSLSLPPGAVFNDTEFAALIGVSRTPVREAVIQLAQESRIIEIFPQRGMRIAYISLERVEESRSLRCLLEKEMAKRACEMAEMDDLRELEENIRLQEFFKGDPKRLLELDNQFHRKLFMICRRELTWNLCQRLSIHYDRIRSLSVSHGTDDGIVQDHRTLMEAISQKDAAQAEALMERHLNHWKMEEGLFREKYGRYFEE